MTGIENGIQVPYCTGRNYPKYTIPDYACDSHHHIYDPVRFPYQPTDVRNQPPATVECYWMLQKKLGTTRNVIVQPSAYGTDNQCTLDALKTMGKENTRAIVVVDPTISDAELQELDKQGVRGLRINISCGAADDFAMVEALAKRIAPMNWCICFWMGADITAQKEEFLANLPCQIVFDHRGHIPAFDGINHPAFGVICRLMQKNKAWVKLSGLYMDSKTTNYQDTVLVGKEYVKVNPDRCLWGTDWPHPRCYTNLQPMPNDSDMLDLLMEQAGSKVNFNKILVDNPAQLFGF